MCPLSLPWWYCLEDGVYLMTQTIMSSRIGQAAPVPTLSTTPEIQAKWDAVDRIDLSNVRRKLLLDAPEGAGLSEATADLAITWYRRYLKLHAKYGDRRLVPSHFIDAVWHLHILDTRAYARDCNAIFGEMLHHYPYFGMNGDAAQRDDAFHQTDLLYIQEFGVSCKGATGHEESGSMCDGDGGGCE